MAIWASFAKYFSLVEFVPREISRIAYYVACMTV